jgi:hypothetical protein
MSSKLDKIVNLDRFALCRLETLSTLQHPHFSLSMSAMAAELVGAIWDFMISIQCH